MELIKKENLGSLIPLTLNVLSSFVKCKSVLSTNFLSLPFWPYIVIPLAKPARVSAGEGEGLVLAGVASRRLVADGPAVANVVHTL